MIRALLACCFTLLGISASAAGLTAFSSTPVSKPPAPWQIVGLPERYAKPVSQFDVVDLDTAHVLRVRSDKSWGTLAHPVQHAVKIDTLIKWRWRLDQPIAKADIRTKTTEDSPLKLCLSFDMPANNIPAGERALFKLVQFFTKEKIPTATLCYIWAGKETIGYEQASLVTARVRYVVLANENTPLKTWAGKERHIYADFLKAFGHEASAVPALSAILIGADSDNTLGNGLGYVGDVQLSSPAQ